MKNLAKRCLAGLLCGLMLPLSLASCESHDDHTDMTGATTTTATTKPRPVREPDPNWVSAIFGGGPFVTGGAAMAETMKQSGYNTIMLWSVHVGEDGDLVFNDIKVCEDGEYVGKPEWSEAWKSLKEGETSITRIELSVGAWGCADFENIQALITRDGMGEDTILYRNFKALIEATGADAVNYDDESCYHVTSAVAFGRMCESMGVKVTLCPYTNMYFWQQVNDKLGDLVDRVYLQCYGGGINNKVADWEAALGKKIIPGYWNIANAGQGKTAAQVGAALRENKEVVTGGFMWLYDEMRNNDSPNTVKAYASAINLAQYN